MIATRLAWQCHIAAALVVLVGSTALSACAQPVEARAAPAASAPESGAFHPGYPMDGIPWSKRSRYDQVFSASYEDLNTFKLGRIHAADPFLWVIGETFADKFRMPRGWIDPHLKGALALAWRMTPNQVSYCGYGSDPGLCSPALSCQLDMYFDGKTPLPWRDNDLMRDDMIPGLVSAEYLPKLSPRSWALRHAEKGPVIPTERLQMRDRNGRAITPGLNLRLFDRAYEPGVVLLSFDAACPVQPAEGPAVIRFFAPGGAEPQPMHEVAVPVAFVQRITAAYDAKKGPIDEFLRRAEAARGGRAGVDILEGAPWKARPHSDAASNASYEDLNTFKPGRIHAVDPFLWVVSEAFADRFRMPRRWIDPGLQGALAMAWRMSPNETSECGFGLRDPKDCSPPLTCQLDIYFDSKAPLPWNYTDVVRDNLIPALLSADYLPKLSAQSRAWRYIDGGKVYPTQKGAVLTFPFRMQYKDGRQIGSSLILRLFDREYEQGVVLLSFDGACMKVRGEGAGSLSFFDRAEYLRTQGMNTPPAHAVVIPEGFVKLLRTAYQAQSGPIQEFHRRGVDGYMQMLREKDPSDKK